MTRARWTGADAISARLIALAADKVDHVEAPSIVELELANRHGLLPLLAYSAEGLELEAMTTRLAIRQAIMRGHLLRLLERIDASGLRASVLKGPHVADRYYTRPEFRPFGDIDILVERHSLESVLDVIAEDVAVTEIPPKQTKAHKRNVYMADESGMRFNLDLHWNLFSYSQLRGQALPLTDYAWSHAEQKPESPIGPHWALPTDIELCFLAVHSILDHRFRLILFRDFVEAAHHDIDWQSIVSVASRWGLRSTTYISLWLAREAFKARIPSDALDALRPSNSVIRYLEWALPRLDLPRFDGHSTHPVNLASVILNDSWSERIALSVRAPAAFPTWRKRVADEPKLLQSPRVLIVTSTDRRRGAEVFSQRLRDGLARRGWVVEAVSLSASHSDKTVDIEPITDRDSGMVGRLEPRIALALRRKIKAFRPDVVVAAGGATLRYSVVSVPGLTSRLAYVGIGEPAYWIRSRMSRIAHRFLLRRADRVIAVSERTVEQLLALEPSLNGRIHVAYTGVPQELFLESDPQSGGPMRVVMVGSLTPEKDPLLALRSVANLEGVLLRFVGEGTEEARLRAEVVRLGVEDRIEFAGQVEEVGPHLRWGDVLLLTSKTEGLPGAILEASAAGLPTVAVDVGGVREAIVDGMTGYIVPRRDQRLIAESLGRLRDHRHLVQDMGAAAREHTQSHFGLVRSIDQYAQLLQLAAQ